MDKQSTLHGKNLTRIARRLAQDIHSAAALRCAAVFFLSLALSALRFPPRGAAPLGLAYAASRRDTRESLCAFAGAFAGSLLLGGSHGVCYASAAVLCCTCSRVFRSLRPPTAFFFAPACVGVSVVFIQSALTWGQGFWALLGLLPEGLLAAAFCLIFILCGQSHTPQPLFALCRSVYLGMSEQNCEPCGRTAWQPSLAAPRLYAVTRAISELGLAVGPLSESRTRADSENISRIYDRAADEVCRKCSLASLCWSREAVESYDALGGTAQTLRTQGFLRPTDFPAHFASRCLNMEKLCGAINEQYLSYLRRCAMHRRDEHSRRLMREGYDSLCGVLSDVAGAVSRQPERYPGLENRVRSIVRAYVPSASACVYSESESLHIDISLHGEDCEIPDRDALLQSLSLALGRRFCPPEEVLSRSGCILRIREREHFCASVCRAVRQKHGESVCGDSSTHFHTPDGRAVVLLSDGMGTGEAAERLSRTALSLISQFVRSGCSVQDSARAVIPVLAARFEDFGFVTLDLLEINLYTGEGRLLKYGAAPTFVTRGSSVRRFFSTAMPAGIDPVLSSPEPILLRLCEGDRVVMMSDGVCDGTDTDAIARLCRTGTDAQQLASDILSSSDGARAGDDRSVLVITLTASE